MINEPIVVREISSRYCGKDSNLFFISNYPDGRCLGLVWFKSQSGERSEYPVYRWFIELFGGRIIYHNVNSGNGKDNLFSYLEKNHPDHLEWLLFHPEWL